MKMLSVCLVLVLAACAHSGSVDLGVDLSEFRIPGSDRLAEEPWVAHVAVLEDGVKIFLEYEPADGGPRERVLADGEDLPTPADLQDEAEPASGIRKRERECRRVATVLHASPGVLLHSTLRRLPADLGFRVPRLYIVGADSRTLPVFVPVPWVEIEIDNLGAALVHQDITRGLAPEAVTDLRITRQDGQTRYRWMREPESQVETWWSGGDVTLDDEEIRGAGTGPVLPGLVRFLEPRHEFPDHSVAVVMVGIGESARVIDFLRAVECAGGDTSVQFHLYPQPWGWNEQLTHSYSLRIPRARRQLEPMSWFYLSEKKWSLPFRFSMDRAGQTGLKNWPGPPERVRECLIQYAEKASRGWPRRIVLRIDGRVSWAMARPWAVLTSATGIELALRFQHGDYWLDSETELRLPGKPEGERLSMTAAEAAERASEARSRVVVLSAPDSATVNDVWQAALTVMDAGAAGVKFE